MFPATKYAISGQALRDLRTALPYRVQSEGRPALQQRRAMRVSSCSLVLWLPKVADQCQSSSVGRHQSHCLQRKLEGSYRSPPAVRDGVACWYCPHTWLILRTTTATEAEFPVVPARITSKQRAPLSNLASTRIHAASLPILWTCWADISL